jgi:hypothetical protein
MCRTLIKEQRLTTVSTESNLNLIREFTPLRDFADAPENALFNVPIWLLSLISDTAPFSPDMITTNFTGTCIQRQMSTHIRPHNQQPTKKRVRA